MTLSRLVNWLYILRQSSELVDISQCRVHLTPPEFFALKVLNPCLDIPLQLPLALFITIYPEAMLTKTLQHLAGPLPLPLSQTPLYRDWETKINDIIAISDDLIQHLEMDRWCLVAFPFDAVHELDEVQEDQREL